ncbi:MAG: response regulator [Gammaproteobacteria bacterium]|nr:response regulator [Gammaproteobacteria bacterium]
MSVNSHFYASLNSKEHLLQEDLIVVNRRLLALLGSVAIFQQEEETIFEQELDEGMTQQINHHIQNYSVLLVEDNLVAQRISQSQLNHFNCRVDIVETGEEALSLMQKQRYDLVLLDIGLPDCDGREIVCEIRAKKESPNRETPIVALTAHLPDEEKHTCFESGIDYILYKPLTTDGVKSVLNTFLGVQTPTDEENLMFMAEDDEDEEDKMPVIDLAASAKLMQCNEESVKRLLTMLVESLPEEQAEMEQAYQRKSWPQLRKVIHKLHGGSGYCGVLRLKKICSDFETVLVTEQNNQVKFDQLYQKLLREIAAILEDFSKL